MIFTSLSKITDQPVSHNPEIKKKVMLSPGDLPHLTNFSQARFAPGQVAPAHSHDNMCEVFFVEEGEGIIRVNGQDYPVNKGSCIAVEPGEVHEVINSSKSELILTYFGLLVKSEA